MSSYINKQQDKLEFLNQQITDVTCSINSKIKNLAENDNFDKYPDLADFIYLKKMLQQEEKELEDFIYSTLHLNYYKEELLKKTNTVQS
jgi:hypothetical protein